jgi:hypothetical protein
MLMKFDRQLNAHTLDVLATIYNGTNYHGQKDQQVSHVGRVIYLIALPVVEAQDHQTAEVIRRS